MNPTPSNPSTVSAINAQTAGPLRVSHTILFAPDRSVIARAFDDSAEEEANARLLASSYTAFDKAGRELGIDAAELAEKIDLAALIRGLNALRLDPNAEPFAKACAQIQWDKLPHLS